MGTSRAQSTNLPHNQRHGKIIHDATTAIGPSRPPSKIPIKPAKSAIVVRSMRGGPIKSAIGETTWVNSVASGVTKTQTIAETKNSWRVALVMSFNILCQSGFESWVNFSSGFSCDCKNLGTTQMRQPVAINERTHPGLKRSQGWVNAKMIHDAASV